MDEGEVLDMMKKSIGHHHGMLEQIMRKCGMEYNDVYNEFYLYLNDRGLLLPTKFGVTYLAKCFYFFAQNRLRKRNLYYSNYDEDVAVDAITPEMLIILYETIK